MNDPSKWIEHLKEPLVLIGFVILIVSKLISILLKKNIFRLSITASEKMLNKILLYIMVLGFMVIILGFGLAFKKESVGEFTSVKEQIIQETKEAQSPTVITKGKNSKVDITYGDTSQKKNTRQPQGNDVSMKEGQSVSSVGHIKQKTGGKQSPAVLSGGEVNINYKNK